MKRQFTVSTKIWLSLSLLVLGYFISISLGFYLGRQTEYRLARVSEYLYPAARDSQTALAAFDEQVKIYQEAIMMGESLYFTSADNQAGQVDKSLSQIAGRQDTNAGKIEEVAAIRREWSAFTERAREFYPLLLSHMSRTNAQAALTEVMNETARQLSREKDMVRSDLSRLAGSFSRELNDELASIRKISKHQRYLNLIIFILVLTVAVIFTSLIINRSIIRPLGKTLMLEKAMEQSRDGIVVADVNGALQFVNRAWAEMHGFEPEELAGVHISFFHSEEQYRQEFIPYHEEARVKGAGSREVGHQKKDGSIFPTMMTAGVIRTSDNRPLRLVYIARDISGQKEHEKELRQAKEDAEQAARTKSEFLANMSHEIRTPMNGIIGMVRLLLNSDLDREQREFAEIIQQSADLLLLIIDDILDFSKIEAGKLTIEKIDFDIINTVETTGEMLALKAYQKQLDLFYSIDPEVPIYLKGDPHRLKQILINLAGNAIKFTDRGDVAIHVGLVDETEANARLKITVTDTGIGIPANRLSLLFQPFSQVDSSTTREYGGTGLGLAISRQLVEMMGGEICVESEEGRGSTFWFTVELEKQREDQIRRELLPDAIRGRHILLVSDNVNEMKVLASYLMSWDCRFHNAAGGAEALSEMIQAAKADRPYHLVVIGYTNGQSDGHSLQKQIRSTPIISKTHVALIALPEESAQDMAEGDSLTLLLTRPIKRSHLFNCLMATLGDVGGKEPEDISAKAAVPTIQGATDHSSHRILIVEDNPVNQMLATRILEKFGFQVRVATNGQEAVRILEMELFDVVLMDEQMPKMDGITATAIIRDPGSKIRNNHVPIIAMTAHAMTGDRERFIAAGMNDYIAKPFRLEHLYNVVSKYIPI
ncbi:MAG: response regulator [Thermodesulfobacteriota bacterium]